MVLSAGLLAGPARASAPIPPDTAGGADAPAAVEADASMAVGDASPPDAEPRPPRDLSSLLLQRGTAPPTSPAGAREQAPAGPALPADGSMEVNRLARLERLADGWFALHLVDDDGVPLGPPRLVLFDHYLEQIEYLADQTPPPAMRISGENGIYKGIAFIRLIEPPLLLRPIVPQPETSAGPEAGSGDAAAGPLPAEVVRQRLMEGDEGRRLPVPPQPDVERAAMPSGDSVGNRAFRYGRGEMVVDRLIRLAPQREDGWLMARFEADNTLRQPPLRLLPCRHLELAERRAFAPGNRMPRFRASGIILTHRGTQYLLLRKLIEERNMGQF